MAKNLEALPLLGRDVFARGKVAFEDESEELHLASLCALFFQLIKAKEERYFEVREIRPTLEEKLTYIRKILDQKGSFVWRAQNEENHSERVASVLAMLELAKLRLAKMSQRKVFGTILLKKKVILMAQSRTAKTLIIICSLIAVVFFVSLIRGVTRSGGAKIAVLEIEGVIRDSKEVMQNIVKFKEDDSVRGVILRINSPGGAVGPTQEIFREVVKLKEKKPVYVSMGSSAPRAATT